MRVRVCECGAWRVSGVGGVGEQVKSQRYALPAGGNGSTGQEEARRRYPASSNYSGHGRSGGRRSERNSSARNTGPGATSKNQQEQRLKIGRLEDWKTGGLKRLED